MKRVLAMVLVAAGSTVLLGATAASPAAASHEPAHWCQAKDVPDYSFNGQELKVNLRTEIVCFDNPIAVG